LKDEAICSVQQRSDQYPTGRIEQNFMTRTKELVFARARFNGNQRFVGTDAVLLRRFRARANSRPLLCGALYFQDSGTDPNRDTPGNCLRGRNDQ
jgi:hypothetical protein